MSTATLDPRLAREIEHFDQVYAAEEQTSPLLLTERDKQRYANPPATTMFSKEYCYHLLGGLQGKKVLEIACGNGVDTCLAAFYGADVSAYDISPAAIHLTRKRAEANGLSDRIHLEACGDLTQAFAGEEFDAIVGYAALHHLPLAGLGEQLRDRLRPGGVAVFQEPVVNSPLLARVRQWIPYLPTAVTDDEEPLNDRVIAELAQSFDRLQRREFECVSRIYPLLKRYRPLVRALFRLDRQLMKIKPLRRFASVTAFGLYRDA